MSRGIETNMPDGDEVIVTTQGKAGVILLNRPGALNALSLPMIRGIAAALEAWRNDPAVDTVVFKGAGDRAFCAGGDIRAVYSEGVRAKAEGRDNSVAIAFFAEEYALNLQMAHYPKPMIALMHGIIMGGGYGLASQCAIRVACPDSRFAMPEVGIGFFPDVGSAWHLSRMPDRLGFCLGLTGMTVGPGDMFATGVATHYVTGDAMARMMEEPHDIAALLAGAVIRPQAGDLERQRAMIARVFAAPDIETILALLAEDGSAFALTMADTIATRSPLSLKVTLAHLQQAARDTDFDAVLARDFQLAQRFLRDADFYEGVRAAVIDRDKNPAWRHKRAEDVTAADIADYLRYDANNKPQRS